MGKRIAIKRVEPIELEFEDGTIKKLLLNNSALLILTEEFGDINNVIKDADKKPLDTLAKLIYAGIKVNESDFTYEEAEVIAYNGGYSLLIDVTEHLAQVLGAYATDDEIKKKLNSQISNFIKQMK